MSWAVLVRCTMLWCYYVSLRLDSTDHCCDLWPKKQAVISGTHTYCIISALLAFCFYPYLYILYSYKFCNMYKACIVGTLYSIEMHWLHWQLLCDGSETLLGRLYNRSIASKGEGIEEVKVSLLCWTLTGGTFKSIGQKHRHKVKEFLV